MTKGTIWTDPQGEPVQTMARGLARKLNAMVRLLKQVLFLNSFNKQINESEH